MDSKKSARDRDGNGEVVALLCPSGVWSVPGPALLLLLLLWSPQRVATCVSVPEQCLRGVATVVLWSGLPCWMLGLRLHSPSTILLLLVASLFVGLPPSSELSRALLPYVSVILAGA